MEYYTIDTIPGAEITPLGLASGSTVQAVHLGKDFMAGIKNLVGGEVGSYTEMMEEARNIAITRMCEEAERMGADAVVGVRFGSASVMQSAAEVFAYGTAVKVRRYE